MKLIELTKVCKKCGKRKNWLDFHKEKGFILGINSKCKVCKNKYSEIYRKNHEKTVEFREMNKKYQKKYREINKERLIVCRKIYVKNNKEKIKDLNQNYIKNNKEKIKIKKREYQEKNYKKIRAKCRIYENNKRKTNIRFKLKRDMSKQIRYSLKNGNGKNGHHWETLVPYNLNDLIKRLKKTLPAGYSWDNYISGKTDLSIDHIIPVSVHNFKSHTDTDFQKCWALKNLQLLPLIKNISKGAKLKKHFQPSLLI